MSRAALLSAIIIPLLLSSASAQEPETAAPASVAEDLKALRQMAEQQSRAIETLTLQVLRLNQRFDTPPKATPAEVAAPAAPTLQPDPPSTEPVVAGPKHPVAKGETLTSIAKRYNIPVADLQNANGIKDDRKLQIGQVLSIPAPSSKPSEPSNPKKENP